jgi:hypothetical protein
MRTWKKTVNIVHTNYNCKLLLESFSEWNEMLPYLPNEAVATSYL